MDASINAEAIEAWNTVLYEKFCRFRHIVTTGLAGHGDVALLRHPPAPGQRVLDVGCGFGDTTIELARQVGPEGRAVGIDAAENFIEGANREAAAAGVDNVRFLARDVQTGDLEGPYDLAFSRFGTMFFVSTVAALRNIRKSLVEGGKLVMVVWRRREDNPWLHAAERCVREIIPEEEETLDAPTCGPGPFSMAGPDMVSDQLLASGYCDISFARTEVPILIGQDLDEAVEFAMALGPAGEIVRLAGETGVRKKPLVVEALREALSVFRTDEGIVAPSSSWVISARAVD